MARRLNKREYFLIAVFAGLGLLALYYGRGNGFGFGGESGEEQAEPLVLGEAPAVHVERLDLPAEDYDAKARNLFAYYQPPRPERPRPKPQPAERTPKPTPPPRKPKQEPRVVRSEPKPPNISFHYLGFLGPKDDKIAVFEQGQEMLLARAGEVLEDKFRVIEFKYESIVMGYTDERFKDKTTELSMKRR